MTTRPRLLKKPPQLLNHFYLYPREVSRGKRALGSMLFYQMRMTLADQVLYEVGEVAGLGRELLDFLLRGDLSPHVLGQVSLGSAVVEVIQQVGVFFGQDGAQRLEYGGVVALA